jgi:hypothetical protein
MELKPELGWRQSAVHHGGALGGRSAVTAVALDQGSCCFNVLAIRAVFSFIGFAAQAERHLVLHHDGYPTGAAWRLSQALRHAASPSELLAVFLITQPGAVSLANAEEAGDAEYRYLVQLITGREATLELQCWRRLQAGSGWIRRYEAMPLVAFIQRFLPGEAI